MNTYKCRCCDNELYSSPLFCFKNMPSSAQGMPSKNELSSDKPIDLDLYQCPKCGLIQFVCEPVSYYKDVIRSTGFTSTMTEVRRNEYKSFIKDYNLDKKKIIEIGCGQGEYLSILNEYDVNAYGIENNIDLCEIASKNHLKVFNGYVTDNYLIQEGPFDAFVCFNYLEHQANPNSFLSGIFNNLKEESYGLITVPDFNFILDNGGFYEFIRDHIVYYNMNSFCYVLEKNGFNVLSCDISNGDTLIARVKKKTKTDISILKKSYINLNNEYKNYILNIKNDSSLKYGGKIAVWGASHQSFALLQMLEIYKDIEYIIDSAPFKQGKYSPASHIIIKSPEEIHSNPVDSILIIAPTYANEISEIIKNKYKEVSSIYSIKGNNLVELLSIN